MKTALAQFTTLISDRGAVLSLYPGEGGGRIESIPVVDVRPTERRAAGGTRLDAVMVYQPFTAYTGGVHRIEFDEARVVNTRSVEFIRDGRRIAIIEQPNESDWPDASRVLEEWRRHLENPDNRRRHEEAIRFEYELSPYPS